MSRHTRIKQTVEKQRKLMNEHSSNQSDSEEDDFTAQQWDTIYNLVQVMQISKEKAIEALKEKDGDFDGAITWIQTELEKEQDKQAKKQEKKKLEDSLKEKKISQGPGPITLEKRQSQGPNRKISIEEGQIPRKSSYIVEQYQTNHYNEQYPSLEVQKDMKPSKTINIVVVGHVDSGKSTLVGMLLHQIKFISNKEIHKNQKLSKELGKQSFKYAFVTDQTEQQRNRGVTIDVGVKKIEFQDKQIVFLDSPGHRDFVPNMISGAAQADYAILVIDITHFESSFQNGGQTKEHAYIVKSLGVHKIIVAMNKMDLVNWNPDSFQKVKKTLNYYLLKIGFLEQSIIYIPLSAYYGLNVVKKRNQIFESGKTVYKETLLETINNLPLPIRPLDKPLRMSITNFYDSQQGKIKGHCISGKIQGGLLKKDDKVVILPQNCQCLIKNILRNNQKVDQAIVGDHVEVQIKLIDETYFDTIKYGNVLSSLKYSIPVSKKIVVQALAFEFETPILKGTPIMLYIGANKTPARVTKINYIFDPNKGTIIKKNPKCLRSNDCAEIQIQTDNKVCVELFSNYKVFGRVIIREKTQTLCVGTVKMIK